MVFFKKMPSLIFDHKEMIQMAKEKLRYKAAFQPVLFELLTGQIHFAAIAEFI